MLRLLTLLLSCAAVCAQPVLSLNDPTVVAKSSSLLQGLVGYWQLEESSGTRYDRSPNGNHLTSNNSVGSAAGKVGNCGTFVPSSSQYLSGLTNQFENRTNLSVFGWMKTTNTNGNLAVLGRSQTTTNKRKFTMLTSLTSWTQDGTATGNELGVVLSSDGGGSNVKIYWGGSGIATGSWNHVGFTWNSGTLKLYVNSVEPTIHKQNDVAFTSLFNSDTKITLGGINPDTSGAALFDGSIDEVGIWNRVLSTTEITQLYRSGLGVTYPRFSMRDNRADDFDFDTWEPIYDKPKPFPTLYAFVNRREPEPLLTICE